MRSNSLFQRLNSCQFPRCSSCLFPSLFLFGSLPFFSMPLSHYLFPLLSLSHYTSPMSSSKTVHSRRHKFIKCLFILLLTTQPSLDSSVQWRHNSALNGVFSIITQNSQLIKPPIYKSSRVVKNLFRQYSRGQLFISYNRQLLSS